MPHILIVGLKWPPETFIHRLINGLLETNWEITVATAIKPTPRPNLHWLFLPSSKSNLINRLIFLSREVLRSYLFAYQDIQLLRGSQWPQVNWYNLIRLFPFAGRHWDVIYFPWNSSAIEYLPLYRLGIPVVLSCRGSQVKVAPHNPQRQSLIDGLQTTFTQASLVHCVSEDIKCEAEKYGLAPSKARVIRPAVDPEFFKPVPYRKEVGNLQIVSVGNLVWVKGYEYALLAIRHLLDQGISLNYHIIGDGSAYQQILYTIYDLCLEKSVTLHGRKTPSEVQEILLHSDVFLLSSLSEGISNAVLEAMACGLPVVTTDCGGMREVVTDGREGFVVPVREPEQMATKLATLAHDLELRRAMGAAARQRIVQDFSLAQQIEQFCLLFKQAVESHS